MNAKDQDLKVLCTDFHLWQTVLCDEFASVAPGRCSLEIETRCKEIRCVYVPRTSRHGVTGYDVKVNDFEYRY